MKIIEKITIAITIIFITLFSITNQIYTVNAETAGQLIDSANSFIANGEADQTGTINQEKMNEAINLMFNIALAIGTFVAFVVGIIVGIKLMVAATADEKAHYKKILVTYIVGCVVIFGSYGIWKLVVTTVNNVTPDGTPTQQTNGSGLTDNNIQEFQKRLDETYQRWQQETDPTKKKQIFEEYQRLRNESLGIETTTNKDETTTQKDEATKKREGIDLHH